MFKDKMCKTTVVWRSWDKTKQCCLFCYLCYCLPNSTGEIPL